MVFLLKLQCIFVPICRVICHIVPSTGFFKRFLSSQISVRIVLPQLALKDTADNLAHRYSAFKGAIQSARHLLLWGWTCSRNLQFCYVLEAESMHRCLLILSVFAYIILWALASAFAVSTKVLGMRNLWSWPNKLAGKAGLRHLLKHWRYNLALCHHVQQTTSLSEFLLCGLTPKTCAARLEQPLQCDPWYQIVFRFVFCTSCPNQWCIQRQAEIHQSHWTVT